jgi:hypothetical protein
MVVSIQLVLLYVLIVPCLAQGSQTSQPPGLESIHDPDKGKRLINYWADFACFTFSDNSEPSIKDQCKEACFPGGIASDSLTSGLIENSQTCWLNGPESDSRTGMPLTVDQKK